MTGRICAHPSCRKPLVRRPGEREGRFLDRDYCDVVCYRGLRVAGLKPSGAPGIPDEIRVCAFELCRKPLERREGEKPWRFRARACCDKSCSNRRSHNSTVVDPGEGRRCELCDALLVRRGEEHLGRWAARRFCSQLCAGRHTIAAAGKARIAGVGAPAEVKACGRCGATMTRQAGDPPHKFNARKYCSDTCRYRQDPDRPKRRKSIVDLPTEKQCAGCPTVIVWDRDKLGPAQWRAKRFCTAGCASRFRVEPKVVPPEEQPPAAAAASKPAVARRPAGPPPEPVVRPDPAALLPHPTVVDMDRRHRVALRMLNDEIPAHLVAAEVGVSLAQIRRWDSGEAS